MQALYLASQAFKRRDTGSNMLLVSVVIKIHVHMDYGNLHEIVRDLGLSIYFFCVSKGITLNFLFAFGLLQAMFGGLDKFVAPDRPCHSSLW